MNNKLPLSNVVDELHRNAIMNASHQVKMADGSLSDIRDKLIEDSSKALSDSTKETAKQYYEHIHQGIYKTYQSYADGANRNEVSLFGYAKSSIISSRLYIEETLATEAIIPNLTRNLLNLYVGMIITALNLDKFVADGRKVSEIMSLVATEDFTPQLKNIDISQVVSDYFIPTSAKRHLSEAVLSDYNFIPAMEDDTSSASNIKEINNTDRSRNTEKTTDFSYKPMTLVPKDMQLPCSAMIQFDIDTSAVSTSVVTSKGLDAPNLSMRDVDKTSELNKSNRKLSILVQLRPSFIPSTVMKAFVDMNFTLPFAKRWLQATAGEISFFKDFLLGFDIDKRYRKALRDDKTGVLKEMFENQASALSRHFEKIASHSPIIRNLMYWNQSSKSINIANTILIFDKQSFDRACNTSGINFNNYDVRKRFFEKTYAMIICLVDPNYNYIHMFYNGIAQPSMFTFNQINTNAKTEATDLISIMKSYAANMAPKF